MNADEAKERLGKALFLDVREPYEWESGHIEGSVHIPMGEVTQRLGDLEGSSEIVVVCQVGQRSELVAEWLNAQGLSAQNLEGGLVEWHARGLPLIEGR